MAPETRSAEEVPPIAVTIAGSDLGGGAGIQADIKTFSALGVYGASIVTALTAQNTREISGIRDVPEDFVARQIDAVYSDLDVAATKIGMLSRVEVVTTVAVGLRRWRARHVVLDPVLIASSGARLLSANAVEALVSLLPLADLVTPNLHEAAALLGEAVAPDESAMMRQGERLMRLGARAVLIKGGHGGGTESTDISSVLKAWRATRPRGSRPPTRMERVARFLPRSRPRLPRGRASPMRCVRQSST